MTESKSAEWLIIAQDAVQSRICCSSWGVPLTLELAGRWGKRGRVWEHLSSPIGWAPWSLLKEETAGVAVSVGGSVAIIFGKQSAQHSALPSASTAIMEPHWILNEN